MLARLSLAAPAWAIMGRRRLQRRTLVQAGPSHILRAGVAAVSARLLSLECPGTLVTALDSAELVGIGRRGTLHPTWLGHVSSGTADRTGHPNPADGNVDPNPADRTEATSGSG